jgi:DNA-binding FadR family transcriptional regulator
VGAAEGGTPLQKARELSRTVLKSLMDRRLRPGDRLPTEMELTKEFSVSRPTLRQALKVLEFSGLIESSPRRGTILTRSDPGALAPLLAVHIAISDAGPITPESQRASFAEARWLLERSVAVLAVKRCQKPDLAAICAAESRFADCVNRFDEHGRLAADAAFHQAYIASAHNSVFSNLGGLLDGYFAEIASARPPNPANVASWLEEHQRTIAEHRMIREALQNGNLTRLEKTIDKHLLRPVVRYSDAMIQKRQKLPSLRRGRSQ